MGGRGSDNIALYDYIKNSQGNQDRYNRLIAIRTEMEGTLLRGAFNGEYDEYNLDDGQTKLKVIYRNQTEVVNAINAIDSLITKVQNRLIGRTFGLKDAKTIKYYNRY